MSLTKILAALTVLSAVQAVADDKIVGGPYVIHVDQRSATVHWIVQSGTVTLTSQGGKGDKSAPVLRDEKVSFTGLTPGTTFEYALPGHADVKGSFKTAPKDPVPFQFVVYGDTRTRHEVHRHVVEAIVKYANPEFVVHTGDLVADGADSSQWPIFFDIEHDLLRKVAFFPSLGNHERNNQQYYEFFDVTTPYYSFNWGGGHFIVLNSDIGNVASSQVLRDDYWKEQVRWLEEDLQHSQSADFRFVIAHHPPLTAVERRQGDNPHMAALMPMFEKYNLTAGFFGHDHNYQHYLRNGIHYFITGGGGAPLYDVKKPPPGITQKVESVEHFVVVHVDGKKARVEALRLDGTPIEVTEMVSH